MLTHAAVTIVLSPCCPPKAGPPRAEKLLLLHDRIPCPQTLGKCFGIVRADIIGAALCREELGRERARLYIVCLRREGDCGSIEVFQKRLARNANHQRQIESAFYFV